MLGKSLKPTTRRAICGFFFDTVLFGAVLLFAACYPKRADIPVKLHADQNKALSAAIEHASTISGKAYLVQGVSMRPSIVATDVVVIRTGTMPSAKSLMGKPICYMAEFRDPNDSPVVHRVVGEDKYGLILSGDNNEVSEPKYRVTAKNYVGEVIAIHRVKP